MNYIRILIGCFLTVFLLHACKKGEPLEVQSYMRINLEAFYTDTSLYYQVKLDDKILREESIVGGNSVTTLLAKDVEFITSGRLVVKVIKKNNAVLLLDTTIFFTNFNEYLLVQLDPKKSATLVNKQTETVTLEKPGTDSIKARFYYNGSDEIKRNGVLLTKIDLQLYSYPADELFSRAPNPPLLKTEGRLRNISSGILSDYFSLAAVDKNKKKLAYVFDIYPPSSTAATLPLYKKKFDDTDGYTGGNLSLGDGTSIFSTVRVAKLDATYRYGSFLFGFK